MVTQKCITIFTSQLFSITEIVKRKSRRIYRNFMAKDMSPKCDILTNFNFNKKAIKRHFQIVTKDVPFLFIYSSYYINYYAGDTV
jgi:hypothetical protein